MKNMNMVMNMHRLIEAYAIVCKPVCDEMGMPLPAFDILMTVAQTPHSITAHEISQMRAIKPTLVSFHVEKLVNAGFLQRQSIYGDRRSIRLVCTDKAMPLVERGKELQEMFTAILWEGIGEDDKEVFKKVITKFDSNAELIKATLNHS